MRCEWQIRCESQMHCESLDSPEAYLAYLACEACEACEARQSHWLPQPREPRVLEVQKVRDSRALPLLQEDLRYPLSPWEMVEKEGQDQAQQEVLEALEQALELRLVVEESIQSCFRKSHLDHCD